MNKVEALEKLKRLQTIIESANYIDNVSWSSDIAPVETFAKQLGIWNDPAVYKALETLHTGLTYNSNGRRGRITWTQVYDLFGAMKSAIEAMP